MSGMCYLGADGSEIPNCGERTICAVTEGGSAAKMRFQVCPVTKALGSVSRMTQAGNRVVFDSLDSIEGSYIENKITGERNNRRAAFSKAGSMNEDKPIRPKANYKRKKEIQGLEDRRRSEDEEEEQESRVTGGSSSSSGNGRAEVEVIEEEVEEAKSAKAAITPKTPTPEEYRIHRLTHLPYRSWCPHCVRGKKRNPSHRILHKEKDGKRGIPVVSMDYTFIGNKDDEH
eukprot:390207-Karenia_brevis.AAC.1